MIGATLKEARESCHLSLGALSLKTGISKATLSRWEAGKSRPYAPQLAHVLEVLRVPETVRHQCFQQLGTAQAERYLSQTIPESAPLPVSGGELIRALRQRSGLSQSDVARAIGVTQALLSRWENNDCWPADEKLVELCDFLRATRGEKHGLRTRAWQNHRELPRDKDELDHSLYLLGILDHHFEHDLLYLAIGSRYQSLYKSNHISYTDSLTVWGNFGNYLVWHGRMAEAYQIAKPVFEDFRSSSLPLTIAQIFALSALGGSLAVLSSNEKAVELVSAFGDRINLRDRGMWYEDLADLTWKAGHWPQAHHYHEKSIETAKSTETERYMRLRYAEHLCLEGRAQEVLRQAEHSHIDICNPHAVIHHKLICGGALGLLGATDEASTLLTQANDRLRQTPYPGLLDFSHKLQQKLPC